MKNSPQPLTCTLKSAAVSASTKLEEGVPWLGLLLGGCGCSRDWVLAAFREHQHTLATYTVEDPP